MKIYAAPMEGVTGYIYRNIYNKHFEAADKYFTPFISTHKKLGNKVKKDIEPANNMGINLIPQVMIGSADEAHELEGLIIPYGYDELNINAGCPSGTVANKFRGSGLLKNPDALDRMLGELFDSSTVKYSIKTRIGWSDVSEWEEIAKIYAKYPFTEVIIHARVREEYYNGMAHQEILDIARDYISAPICYNGDIYSAEDAYRCIDKYPWLAGIMVGRGLLRNPGLIEMIHGSSFDGKEYKARVYAFMDELFETYLEAFDSEINTLYHMKELWSHLGYSFPEYDKDLKTIRKTKSVQEYKTAVSHILK